MAYGTIEDAPARGLRDRRRDRRARHRHRRARRAAGVPRAGRAAHLVVVNSLLGQVAAPLMGSYIAAKWGQLGLVRVLQQETRDVPGIYDLDPPARRRRHPDLLPGRVLGRQHRPAAAAGLLAAAAGPPGRRAAGPAAAAGAGRHLQPADHRGRSGCSPGVYDFLVGPLLQRLAIADDDVPPTEGNVFASQARRATPPRGAGAASDDPGMPWSRPDRGRGGLTPPAGGSERAVRGPDTVEYGCPRSCALPRPPATSRRREWPPVRPL